MEIERFHRHQPNSADSDLKGNSGILCSRDQRFCRTRWTGTKVRSSPGGLLAAAALHRTSTLCTIKFLPPPVPFAPSHPNTTLAPFRACPSGTLKYLFSKIFKQNYIKVYKDVPNFRTVVQARKNKSLTINNGTFSARARWAVKCVAT